MADPRILRVSLAALLGALLACGSDSDLGQEAEGATAQARSLEQFERPRRDPALAEVRVALEHGRGDLALQLLERVHGFEPECLRARAELVHGDAVAALAALERARELHSDHPELCATEVELLAALARLPSAAEILMEGRRRHGPEPALLRAQGVLELCHQGRGEAALEALERARAGDPELPFLTFPLAQAHLLVGRARLGKAPAESTAHALAARALAGQLGSPDDLFEEALELEAEGLTGELRFEEAIARYEELERRGHSFGETPAILHQRCATRCLLERDRRGAIEHYLAARRLGLAAEELGFGAELLREEQRAAFERGRAAAAAARWQAAEGEFERALELDPGDPELENYLAAAKFQREDFRGAAEAWERALAASERIEFLDPVPLDLAKAWRLAGEPTRARAVLASLLDGDPEGRWSEPARELLAALEAEELAAK